MAKFNLVNNYLVVGVTEELGDFIEIIEALLPSYFYGASKLFNSSEFLLVFFFSVLIHGAVLGSQTVNFCGSSALLFKSPYRSLSINLSIIPVIHLVISLSICRIFIEIGSN